MKKLKDILKESNVQIGKVYSNPYATAFVKENEEQEEPQMELSEEQKKAFLEAVKQYKKYGEAVYRNAGLGEVYESIKNMVEMAGKVTLSETDDWFDNVTVSRHMKRMGESFKVFEKTLKEVSTLQQRLEASYDEIGEVLGKYYEISEELDPVGKEDGDIDNDGDEDASDEYLANRRKVISKAIKNESMKLTDMIKKPSVDESILSEKKPSKIVWDTKIISAAKRINVRKWYMKTYPTDELGGEINQKLTLWEVYTYLSQGYDVYKIIGVSDSVVRERVFEKLSKVLDVDYDTIYNMSESVNEAKNSFKFKHGIKDLKQKLNKGYSIEDGDEDPQTYYVVGKNRETIGVFHYDGNTVTLLDMPKGVFKSVNEAGDFAGWIAIFNGKKLEIDKSQAKDLYNAKLLAIKKLKVPKSKVGLMFIKPAVDESVVNEGKDVGHYERVGNQTIVDSNFVNYSKGVLPNSELVHLGMGDFAIKSQSGMIKFQRSGKMDGIGQDFVGRPHRMTDDKNGKLVELFLKLMLKKKKAILSMSESVMNEAKYDIGMGRKGSGITVYNRAEEEAGDYKTIAHIYDNGVVKYYDKNLPSNIKKKIEAEAKKMKESVNEGTKMIKLKNLLNESFGFGELPSSKLMKMKVPAKQVLKEGTRSQVGYIDNNGNIKSAYVHFDGYPENMKPGIKKHMKSETDVKTLIKRGGARGIFDDKDIEYYDDKSAKPMSGNLEDIEKYIKDSDFKGGAEFVYLYNTKDKKWYFADTYKDKELKKLY